MSALDEIELHIKNETLFGNYKIIGLAEYYGNKPGVHIQCIKCGKITRYRYTNLKSGYRPKCTCLGGREYSVDYNKMIGTIYCGYELSELVYHYIHNYNTAYIRLKCVNCGKTYDRLASELAGKINKGANLRECSCKVRERKLSNSTDKLMRKEMKKVDANSDLISKTLKTDTIIDTQDSTSVVLKCNICGRTRVVRASDVRNEVFRHIPRCECEASGYNKYSKLIGEEIFGDLVIDFRYTKVGKGYYREYIVKCTNCGEIRSIENVSGLYNNSKLSGRPVNLGYKMCNCNPGTRTPNVVDRYKHYIGKTIDGTQLKILDIYVNDNGKLMATTECSCGNIQDQWLPTILNGHTLSCGCKRLEAMANNSLYYKDKYIGKIINDLTIIGMRQTESGGILWNCQCNICGKAEEINPKLVMERNWHIGCGCKIRKASERRQKYTSESLVGTVTSGGKILQILKGTSGTTFWKLECPFCKSEYIARAANIIAGNTRSCGCLGMSLGERLVEECLKEMQIRYKRQYSPKDLINQLNSRLYFDFLIEIKSSLCGIVEYDGAQHYRFDKFTFRESPEENWELFNRLVANDKLKNQYCETHNLPILRLDDEEYHGDKEKIYDAIKKFIETWR